MFISSTHRLEFKRGEEVFITAGGGVQEHAPDWIAGDDYFISNENEGKITNLSTGVQAVGAEDILINGVSIYSWRFPAVNYLPGVSPELYADIVETFKTKTLDIQERNNVTLISDTYVRNEVLQEIAVKLTEELQNQKPEKEDSEVVPGGGAENSAENMQENIPAATTESTTAPESEESESADIDEDGEDAGTLSVKSLAAKIKMNVTLTKNLLKSEHNFEATTGATLVPQEIFDKVVQEFEAKE